MITSVQLSAFLDGELPPSEQHAIEKALAEDPALQAELEALMAADTLAQTEFSDRLAEPVPDALLAAIQNAPTPGIETSMPSIQMPDGQPSPLQRAGGLRPWMMAAAAALTLVIGGVGGYVAGLNTGAQQVAAAPGWLNAIADYHAIYAGQTRHLVEVGADETDHIQTWLTGTLGEQVTIPDLSAQGLSFQGARLLVAAGKPVAQLMYLDGDGAVVALCQIQSPNSNDGFAQHTIGAFDMVSWGGDGSNFVVVGDTSRDGLDAVAQAAASQV